MLSKVGSPRWRLMLGQLALGLLLAYAATYGINQIWKLGGSFDALEILNPLLVQQYEAEPLDAERYLVWESSSFRRGTLALVVQDREVKVMDVGFSRPEGIRFQFFGESFRKGSYNLVVGETTAPALVTIIQQPSADNGYISKVRIRKLYGPSNFRLSLFARGVEDELAVVREQHDDQR